jgi:hypothetical protein
VETSSLLTDETKLTLNKDISTMKIAKKDKGAANIKMGRRAASNSDLSFEHGWLQVELMDVTDDMKFSAEYWTY